MLTDITKSQADPLEDQPLPCNQRITCTPSQLYSLIWTALAENTPDASPGLLFLQICWENLLTNLIPPEYSRLSIYCLSSNYAKTKT